MPAANVLIVAGRKLMREGLANLLAGQEGIRVCGDADSGLTATRMIVPMDIHVVVLILPSDVQSGVELVRSFLDLRDDLRVIVLPLHCSQDLLLTLLQVGVCGCLTRDCDSREIVTAIRTVIAGTTYLSPVLSSMMRQDQQMRTVRNAGNPTSGARQLAPRERDILRRIASGHTTKEIAYTLQVSVKTIETHRRRIMQKLDRHSVAELTQYALSEGLISLPPFIGSIAQSAR